MSSFSAESPSVIRSADEEQEKQVRYSKAMQNLFVILNGGILEFLQLKYQSANSSPFHTHGDTILLFFIFTTVYVALRLSEIRLRHPMMLRKIIGKFSHLFGALATLLLLSIISSGFFLFLLSFWSVWFAAVAYDSYEELNSSPENASDANPDHPPENASDANPNQPPVVSDPNQLPV